MHQYINSIHSISEITFHIHHVYKLTKYLRGERHLHRYFLYSGPSLELNHLIFQGKYADKYMTSKIAR